MESIFGDVAIGPQQVHKVLGRHVLDDGYKLVYDTSASHGSWIVDARSGEEYLDLYTFFASAPLGSNPRGLADDPEFMAVLAEAAANKPPNPDMFTTHYAQFVETFVRVLGDPALPHLFFVEGGALAVENALKTRVRLEEQAQRGGGPVPPARHQGAAPHPGVPRPVRVHAVADQHRAGQDRPVPEVRLAEDRGARGQVPAGPSTSPRWSRPRREPCAQARAAFEAEPHDIACFLAEPIQGEGGDNHMRPEFLRAMQEMCHTYDALFVLDEVQTGVGLTGTAVGLPAARPAARRRRVRQEGAARRHHGRPSRRRGRGQRLRGLRPDQLDLGRRARRHGALPAASGDHRAGRADRPRRQGRKLAARRAAGRSRNGTRSWRRTSAGRGLMCAFDLPGQARTADTAVRMLLEEHVVLLPCGEQTIRFRPALDVTEQDSRSAWPPSTACLAAA